jgi:hypothetical protein
MHLKSRSPGNIFEELELITADAHIIIPIPIA